MTAVLDRIGGQRADRFVFRLLNANRSPAGPDLLVQESSTPRVQVQTGRKIMRTCSGVTISNVPADLDPNRMRVQPILTLSDGTVWPLGILMFGTLGERVYATGNELAPELFDENFLLDQGLDRTWSLEKDASVLATFMAMAAEVLVPLGIPHTYSVQDQPAANPISWKVGSSRLDALNAMATLLGALPPFFDNSGTHRLKAPPQTGSADHVYASGGRIFDATTTLSSNRYKAPNRYIVVGDDVSGSPVRGVYDLPDAAPNSLAKTGRVVTAPTHTASGVKDAGLAAQIAYVDALTDKTAYATARFSAAADPRHDVFDSFALFGDLYLETGWDLACVSGGEHSHDGTRQWGIG
jgi:hypothetical protein